jgi:hypothetical protein
MKSRHSIQRLTVSEITLDDGSVWRIAPIASVATWSLADTVELEASHEPPTIWNVTRNEHIKVSAVRE